MSCGLKKYVITGHILEVYSYDYYIHGKGGFSGTAKGQAEIENALKNYANTNQRRRDKIRRLACTNFNNKYDKFLTLTFAENKTNIEECNLLFKNFIKRLKYKYNLLCLKYLAVIEFQERGAVHYHVLLNIPYIPHKELQELWGNGFVFVNAISHVDNLGAYILKYMTKDNNDTRLMGKKAYLTSRNLKQEETIVNHDLKDFDKLESKIIQKYNLNDLKAVYEANYDTEMLGNCTYKQYNLERI